MRLPAPLRALALGAACLSGVGAHAQLGTCEPRWSPGFGELPGVNGAVFTMAGFDDGSGPALYVGGNFQTAGGVPAENVARWDGARWSALGDGLGSSHFYVQALLVHDDGGGPALYAAGYFVNSGNLPVLNVARWNGARWTDVGGGLNNAVNALAVFDDGGGPALYAAGFFQGFVARWDGVRWLPLGSGTSDVVNTLAVFDDGRGPALYAGGVFTVAGGVSASRVARWNGASWSRVGSGLNQRVAALRAYDDGSGPALFATGDFDRAGTVQASRIARWNGASWSPLGAGLSSSRGPAPRGEALAVYDDGRGPALYVSGFFKRAGVLAVNHVARWNGSSWSALADGFTFSTIGVGLALGVFDDGGGSQLYVGGALGELDGSDVHGIARWDGASWSMPGAGPNDDVAALAVVSGANGAPALVAAGDFTSLGGEPVGRIARQQDGRWQPLGAGMDGRVQALALFDARDGAGASLHAAGAFVTAGGKPAAHVARWDGKDWAALGAGTDGPVRALEVFDDGAGEALYAAGAFAAAGSSTAAGVARWDGARWTPLAAGLAGTASDLAVLDDGHGPALYAAGEFERTGDGLVVNHVARWDGLAWTALADGVDGAVEALAVFDDRSGRGPVLYAAGSFTSASGVPASHVARWDGMGWSALAAGLDQPALALGTCDDGGGAALLAGGFFTLAGGEPAPGVARWDGARWAPLGGGTPGPVLALAVLDDLGRGGPALVAGGAFTRANDSPDAFLACWRGCPDTTAPVLSCPTAIVVSDPPSGPPGEVVTFTVTASDARDPFPSVVCEPPSGSLFPPGVTFVQCKASDAARNQASSSFPVEVRRKAVK